jgi:DNA-binding NarL/FixJ family response regulator
MVLVDVDLPEASSIACVDGLNRRRPAMQIIMLTPQEDYHFLYESLAAGASGYLLKSSSATSLQNSISEFRMFRSNMSAAVALRILKDFPANHGPETAVANLSRIERTILNLVAGGTLATDIKEKLGLRTSRIAIHLHIIYQKLQHRMRWERDYFSPCRKPFNPIIELALTFSHGRQHFQ